MRTVRQTYTDMTDTLRHSFRLSFILSASPLVVPPSSEVLSRLRSAAPWDEASLHPADSDFPRAHISWRQAAGFNLHCFENDLSSGQFLVSRLEFSAPSFEINLGGQALERWPRELFVSEDLATEALEHFLDHGELKPLLFWIGTGQFPRETIWEGREEREAWERSNRR
jgi:hypothetical protein